MNRLKNLAWLLVGSVAFASCDKINNDVVEPEAKAEFSSMINELRVENNRWNTGDEIGVFALNAGQKAIPDGIYDGKANVKFRAESDGAFSETGTSITFPKKGAALDFIAYYPYQEGIVNGIYNVNIADQSNLSKIDLIYSNNAKAQTKTTPRVNLTFDHKLALFEMNLQVVEGAEISLDGAKAAFESILTTATFNLATGELTPGNNPTKMDVTVKKVDESKALISMILIPGTRLEQTPLKVTLEGKEYTWKPKDMLIQAGKKYVVTASVGTVEGEIKTVFGSSITDWVTESIDGGTLTPKDQGSTPGAPDNGEGSGEPGNGDNQSGGDDQSGGGNGSDTPSPAPGQAELLFDGADFENEEVLEKQFTQKLKDVVSIASEGRKGGKALKIFTKKIKKTDYAFKVKQISKDFSNKKAISFYLKGKSDRTFTVEFFIAGEKLYFPLGDVSKDKTVNKGTPQYKNHTIDTKDQWVKITLNIADFAQKIGKETELFGIRMGDGAPYDILIDDITIE